MQESKKLFVVGKKPTKKFALFNIMIPLIFSLLFSIFFGDHFKLGYFTIILNVVTFLLLLFLYVPIIVNCRYYWNISECYLEYYQITDYVQQMRYVLSIFNGKDDMFAFKVKLTEINSIKLYWETISVYPTAPIHVFFFRITLKDASIITFKSSFYNSKKEYLDVLNYLKEKFDIQIEDEYNLLSALEEENINLDEYIDSIEKQKGKWGQKDD